MSITHISLILMAIRLNLIDNHFAEGRSERAVRLLGIAVDEMNKAVCTELDEETFAAVLDDLDLAHSLSLLDVESEARVLVASGKARFRKPIMTHNLVYNRLYKTYADPSGIGALVRLPNDILHTIADMVVDE